ncbi:transcription termination/antitermination protein NusG [Thermopirellula anaerolimosa]
MHGAEHDDERDSLRLVSRGRFGILGEMPLMPCIPMPIARMAAVMPILPREPDILPEDLLERNESADGPWWVIYTLARREKVFFRRLREMGVRHYCPLVPHRVKLGDGRIRTSWNPLFAGYVFLQGDDADRQKALTTNCVSRCLVVRDCEQLVRDLRRIRQAIESGLPVTPQDKLEPGEPVRIRSGPLAGLEGVIVNRRGKHHLIVMVSFIQKGASVELDVVDVEPL